MKKIEDLKQGDRIYDVYSHTIMGYRYCCVHPHNNKYHILINALEEPIRYYEVGLQEILDKNLGTYDEAKEFLITSLESKIDFLRREK